MTNDKKALAIIPARGGSKRMQRKNIRFFLGQPIIKYSIDAAFSSGCFDEVMVSTDDREIAEISGACGAKVPFMRLAKNSDDKATTADVIEEVILKYKEMKYNFNRICCIYPTAPLVKSATIKKAMELLDEAGADSVVPVVRFSYPIQRALKIEQKKLVMIWPENISVRSQDLTPTYHDCGQFYCLKTQKFLEQKKIFSSNTMPVEIPESEVQDIDNEEDWKMAEIKYKILNKLRYEG